MGLVASLGGAVSAAHSIAKSPFQTPFKNTLGIATATIASPYLTGKEFDEVVTDPSYTFDPSYTRIQSEGLMNSILGAPGALWRGTIKASFMLQTLPRLRKLIEGQSNVGALTPLGLRSLLFGARGTNVMSKIMQSRGAGLALGTAFTGSPIGGLLTGGVFQGLIKGSVFGKNVGAGGIVGLFGTEAQTKVRSMISGFGPETQIFGTRIATRQMPGKEFTFQEATYQGAAITSQAKAPAAIKLFGKRDVKKATDIIREQASELRSFGTSIAQGEVKIPRTRTLIGKNITTHKFGPFAPAGYGLSFMDELNWRLNLKGGTKGLIGTMDSSVNTGFDKNTFTKAFAGGMVADVFQRDLTTHLIGKHRFLNYMMPSLGPLRLLYRLTKLGSKGVLQESMNINQYVDDATKALNNMVAMPKAAAASATAAQDIARAAEKTTEQKAVSMYKRTIPGRSGILTNEILFDTKASQMSKIAHVSIGKAGAMAGASVLSTYLTASWVWGGVKKAGGAAISATLNTIQTASTIAKNIGSMEFGTGKTLETRMASTERSRAIAAMQDIGISARSYLGNEAAIMAQG